SHAGLEIKIQGRGLMILAVDDDHISRRIALGDGDGELFGRKDRREGHKCRMNTRQEGNHHSCEHYVGMNRFALKAQPKVQACTNEKRENCADQLRPKAAESFGGEVEEVAKGEIIILRILVEEVGEIGVGSGGL